MTKNALALECHQDGQLPAVWVTRLPGDGWWITQSDYSVDTPWGNVLVPVGFRFDIASVPRIFWPLIASFELSLVAPMVHDWIYIHAGRISGHDDGRPWTRKEADDAFLWLMKRARVKPWKAWAAYWVVRKFSTAYWGLDPVGRKQKKYNL